MNEANKRKLGFVTWRFEASTTEASGYMEANLPHRREKVGEG